MCLGARPRTFKQGSRWSHEDRNRGRSVRRNTDEPRGNGDLASTPKLAIEHPHQGTAATPTATSPLIRIGHILKRCYERVCSVIFDGDGDF